MSRLFRFLLLLPVLLLAGTALAQTDTPAFDSAACPFNEPSGYSIECGYVTVPVSRDPASTDDGILRLAVAVLRSTNAAPEPDPLVYLEGGPGGRLLDTVEFFAVSFQPFLQNRDVILFDQRGVGYSGSLNCPAYEQLSYDLLDQNLTYDEIVPMVNDSLLTCHDQYVEAGIDLTAYTSVENAADVRDIITALGYPQADLMGSSYGTRLALTVMRDHPEVVRSVILDGVLPLQAQPDGELAPNANRAFSALFASCAKDDACTQQYPDLETVFYGTVDRLNAAPETVSAFDYYTGEQRDVLVNGDVLLSSVFSLLYRTGEIPNIPGYIYKASKGNYEDFIAEQFFNNFYNVYFDEGMFITVGCNEETPYDSLDATLASDAGLRPELSIFAVQGAGDFPLCEAWGSAPLNPAENEPVVSDIPTLLTVGEFDPVTPPRWAHEAAETLSNSQVYEFPSIGHTTFSIKDCPTDMMVAFVDDPEAPLDSSCIAEIPPPLYAVGEVTSVSLQPYTSDELGFSSVVPEGWYPVEPGVFSPYPSLDPVTIPVIAYRFPVTLDEYISRIITDGFYAYDSLPPSTTTVRANGRDWQIYQVQRPDENVYTSFAFYDSIDQPYVIGVTATSAEERDFLYDALFLPAIKAFEVTDIVPTAAP